MPQVTTKTVYCLDGVEFQNLIKLQEYCENQLGAIIDKVDAMLPVHQTLTPKQKLGVLSVLIANREEVERALTVVIDLSDNPTHVDLTNVLD